MACTLRHERRDDQAQAEDQRHEVVNPAVTFEMILCHVLGSAVELL